MGLPKYNPPEGEELKLLTELANGVMLIAHAQEERRGTGEPYKVHPLAVAQAVDLKHRPLALLHDVLESKPSLLQKLEFLFPEWLVDRVVLLTRFEGEGYDVYVVRVAEDEAAKAVKIADLRDNIKTLKRGSLLDKYRLALRLLGEVP